MWDLISSLLTGGATGLLGVGISSAVEYYKQKQKNQHELQLLEAERTMMELEIQGRERVAVIESERAQSVEETKLVAASIATDRATYSDGHSRWLVLVDVVRGLTRPLLTAGLIILVSVMWATTDEFETRRQIAATVLYITTAAVLWWFGSRVKQPR